MLFQICWKPIMVWLDLGFGPWPILIAYNPSFPGRGSGPVAWTKTLRFKLFFTSNFFAVLQFNMCFHKLIVSGRGVGATSQRTKSGVLRHLKIKALTHLLQFVDQPCSAIWQWRKFYSCMCSQIYFTTRPTLFHSFSNWLCMIGLLMEILLLWRTALRVKSIIIR